MNFNHRYNSSKISIPDNIESSIGTFTEVTDFQHFNFRQNNAKYKLVGLHTRGSKILVRQDSIYKYYIDNSFPSFCFRANNKAYYCAKSFQKETISSYQIPAGTYSPSDFRELISNYISVGSYRSTANEFTVKVNNQNYTVTKNKYVYRKVSATSPYGCEYIDFESQSSDVKKLEVATTTFNGHYVVWRNGNIGTHAQSYGGYMSFPITISPGINFN